MTHRVEHLSSSISGRIAESVSVVAFWAFALTTAAAPLLHGALAPSTLLALRLGVTASLLAGALFVSFSGKISLRPPLAWGALAIYLALVAASALRSPYAYGSAQAAIDAYVAASGFVLACVLITTERRRRALVLAFSLGVFAMAAAGILQGLGVPFLPDAPRGRVASLFTNPNHFAGLMEMGGPLALALALFPGRALRRMFFSLVAVACYVSLGLTFSYGGWLASGAATTLLLLGWAIHGWTARKTLLPFVGAGALLAAAGAAGLLLLSASPRLDGSLSTRVDAITSVSEIRSLRSRLGIQSASAALVRDHPWLGVGPGNYTDAIVAYRPSTIETVGDDFLHRTLLHAMNDALNVATQSGVPAAAAFVAFWLLVLRPVTRVPPALRFGTTAGLVAVLLHGMVDGNLTFVVGNAYLAFVLAGVLQAGVPADERSEAFP